MCEPVVSSSAPRLRRRPDETESESDGRFSPDEAYAVPWLPMRVPRRSLYIMRDAARYEWSHALPLEQPWDTGGSQPRGRRVALIFRDGHH